MSTAVTVPEIGEWMFADMKLPASAMSWHKYLGDAGRAVSIEHYGASADYATLYEKFGITPAAVVDAAEESITAAKAEA